MVEKRQVGLPDRGLPGCTGTSKGCGPGRLPAQSRARGWPKRLGDGSSRCAGHTASVGEDEERLARLQTERRRLAESGPSAVRSPGDFERVSIRDFDADALRDLLLAEEPTTVTEIGLACGRSALAVAEAMVAGATDAAQHVIIDAYQDQFHRTGWKAIVAAGLDDLCSLVEEQFQFALPRLLENGFYADAAFVDGGHILHRVFVDLVYLRELVRPLPSSLPYLRCRRASPARSERTRAMPDEMSTCPMS